MTKKRCHTCGSATTICCDIFSRWMCPSCAEKWIAHVTDVIGTADGLQWCHEERTDLAPQDAVTGHQVADAGCRRGLMEGM
jgi:hypothetical protein